MKVIILILIAISVVIYGESSWVEISCDSAKSIINNDTTEVIFQSKEVVAIDTSISGKTRNAEIVYYKELEPLLKHEIGYCEPQDSTRRFLARCPEKGRWYKWQED